MKIIAALVTLGVLVLPSIAGYSGSTDSGALLGEAAPRLSLLAVDPGSVVALRDVTLKPNIDPGEFERFVAEEFTPAFEEHVPGVRAFVLKGTRGDRKDGYAFALVFDSERTRDFYFPTEHGGEASVQGVALELWRPGQEMILDRLMQYVDGISETEGYTDYVVLG